MNGLNLIPIHRRRARDRRRRLRAWIIFNSLFLAVLLAAALSGYLFLTADHSPAGDLAKVEQEIDQSNKQMLVIRQQLAEAHQTMVSVNAISDQPDWSIVMAVVGRSLGDNVMLTGCDLAPVAEEAPVVQAISISGKPAAMAPPAPRRVLLHLTGLGRSQAHVAQFVLRLEGTNLFEHVNLLHTNRQALLGGDAVGFELDCPLAGRIGGTP
jgi:Tfp pilus assembly protein PilN